MSEEHIDHPVAPQLPVPDDKIKSSKQLAGYASELTDEEVAKTVQIIYSLQAKYMHKSNNAKNLDALRDEALTRLSEIGIIATLDPSPCFYGEPPVLEILGKIKDDPIHKVGFDHEKKYYEVNKAVERNEDYLGQKEKPNKRKDK